MDSYAHCHGSLGSDSRSILLPRTLVPRTSETGPLRSGEGSHCSFRSPSISWINGSASALRRADRQAILDPIWPKTDYERIRPYQSIKGLNDTDEKLWGIRLGEK